MLKKILQFIFGVRNMALFMHNPCNAEKVKQGKTYKRTISGKISF